MDPIDLPLDMIAEIFSHLKSQYSLFRSLNKQTRDCSISWDGWDALIDQGYWVEIDNWQIEWHRAARFSGEKEESSSTLHRGGDLPAIESIDGDKKWYKNGKKHREGGLPAAITMIEGKWWRKEWFVNNQLHREGDKPALKFQSGYKEWWVNGEGVKTLGCWSPPSDIQ